MSELSSQQPDRTPVQDPQTAGFPAEKPVGDSVPPAGHATPAEEDRGLPPGDHTDPDLPHDLRSAPRLTSPGRHGKRLIPAPDAQRSPFTPQQRLLILDSWSRSGLPAGDFAPLVGVSKHTLFAWKKRFDQLGPVGLTDQPRGGSSGSKLPELTKRTILLLKQSHPDWGCQNGFSLRHRVSGRKAQTTTRAFAVCAASPARPQRRRDLPAPSAGERFLRRFSPLDRCRGFLSGDTRVDRLIRTPSLTA